MGKVYSRRVCLALVCTLTAIVLMPSRSLAQPVNLPQIHRDALHQLELYAGEVVSFDLKQGGVASDRRTIKFIFESKPYTLELHPQSSRSKDYKLIVQHADGSYEEITPGPDLSMRGSVLEIEGSVVAAALSHGELSARVLLPDDSEIWVEPLAGKVAGAQATQHIVYHGDDAVPSGGSCATLDPPFDPDAVPAGPLSDTSSSSGSVAGATVCTGLFLTELAIDADVEYFIEEGSSVAGVEEKVTSIIDFMNVQYERDVCIRHIITTIIVRTAEPGPYSSTVAETLLNQLRSHWETNLGAIPRDVVQLFTGKTITDPQGQPGVIGIAWKGEFPSTLSGNTICGSWGYNVVESNCGFTCGNFQTKTDLSAHELGHNWGAGHCSCLNWTMNPTIQRANRFEPNLTIPSIEAFRDTRNCLDAGDELRRIIASSTTNDIDEGTLLQLTAIADFRFGVDEDVTDLVIWNIDPPEAGTVDALGLFTANDITGTVCATITAEYTFDGVTRTGFLFIRIVDLDNLMAIVSGDPPNGVVDARIPTDLDGFNPIGFQIFDVVLNGDTCGVLTTDFSVMVQGGSNPAPAIADLQEIDTKTVRLLLSAPVEPGTWTTIVHDLSGSSVTVGYLPGDVNGDTISNADDILALIDIINGVVEPGPLWSRDIDRSGRSFPADLLMLINVLNGADSLDAWMGATLP